MTNCVSYQVALQLKAAGFPKPHQLMSSNVQVFVYNTTYQRPILWPYLAGISKIKSDEIFAPTISDILPLCNEGKVTPDIWYSDHEKAFICDSFQRCRSTNIHDAAALAWLHQNQK